MTAQGENAVAKGDSVAKIVTDRIIAEMANGGLPPWRKPWSTFGGPINWTSQKSYRGVNRWLLPAGQYASFKQIQAANGKLKAGSKSHIVTFWKMLDSKEDPTKKIPLLRFYNVFDIADTDLNPRELVARVHQPVVEAEAIVDGYHDKPFIHHGDEHAFYAPGLDTVGMPLPEAFITAEAYYATLFHELIHSTGSKDRLDRVQWSGFGSDSYSKEELVAELGAAMLCAECGIENDIKQSATYIAGWMRKFQEDENLIIRASSAADKAMAYILKGSDDQEGEPE